MKKFLQIKNMLSRLTPLLVTCALLLTLFVGQAARSATLTVNGSCTDANTDGLCDDGSGEYKTIQAAVDAASPNDTLTVLAGTYAENVIVDRALTLTGDPGDLSTVGPGPNAPVVDGGGNAGYGFRIANGVDDVTIQGFVIRNFGTGPESGGGQSAGVGAANTSTDPTTNITVYYNRFEDINWASVFFLNAGQSTYQNIDIHYNEVLIGPWALNTNVYGIECTNCVNTTIAHNEVSGGSNGIVLSAQGTPAYAVTAANNAIRDNTVRNAGEGNILLMSYDPSWTTGAPLLQNTRIEANTLTNDGALSTEGNSAILVYSYEGGTVDGLSLINNTITVSNADNIPIDLATTANITLTDNIITVHNPAVDGRVIYMNSVGGSHINVANNTVTLMGATFANYFHTFELNGSAAPGLLSRSGADVWSQQHPFPLASASTRPQAVSGRPGFQGARIAGNTFIGNYVGTRSAAVRLRDTLPATATVTLVDNTITGFYSGIWPNVPRALIIRDNELIDNGYGINTTGTGTKLGLVATGNVISGNTTTGILLSGTGPMSATVGGSPTNANTFRNNGVDGGSNIIIDLPATNPRLNFYYNAWGVTPICDVMARLHYIGGLPVANGIDVFDMLGGTQPATIPANGVDTATITGTLTGLLDSAGHVISFTTSLGTLSQPADTTDANGDATTTLSSSDPGQAEITTQLATRCGIIRALHSAVEFTSAPPVDLYVYLPLIMHDYTNAPDLVVTALEATGGGITVTILNQGKLPVEDAFWVDAYIDPDTPPQAVNELWMYIGDEGLAWGVEGAALPLSPGAELTLTMGDAYYWPDFSTVITWPIPVGTPIYAQVDSGNPNTDYGAVLEQHEIYDWPYNNITGPVYVQTSPTGAMMPTSPNPRRASNTTLPPREPERMTLER